MGSWIPQTPLSYLRPWFGPSQIKINFNLSSRIEKKNKFNHDTKIFNKCSMYLAVTKICIWLILLSIWEKICIINFICVVYWVFILIFVIKQEIFSSSGKIMMIGLHYTTNKLLFSQQNPLVIYLHKIH